VLHPPVERLDLTPHELAQLSVIQRGAHLLERQAESPQRHDPV
jgi:hypothetical protein